MAAQIDESPQPAYQHTRLEFQRRILRFLIRVIAFNFLVKLDHVEDMENVPESGPVIIMINHISFVDPFVVLHVLKRNIVPLAKVEAYDYPIVGIFPRIWGVIPVRRNEVDRRAIQLALEVLKAGEMILVAPEGTRNHELQEAKEGIAFLASRSGVPILPVAIEGTAGFPSVWPSARWRGPGAVVRFGRPFRLRASEARPSRDELRKMTDESMYVLAAMLPAERRGFYADLGMATQDTIEWV